MIIKAYLVYNFYLVIFQYLIFSTFKGHLDNA